MLLFQILPVDQAFMADSPLNGSFYQESFAVPLTVDPHPGRPMNP